ncbi:DUF3035 domain-containing protein [Allosphingosinicella flava]|uniref:DUF3035 domain-containing protein n=1 Tax=Allosphingosinicella flava TaxID=2771430 RepID=A0A7T2GK65_9SPHN|nr:DUF3035 domain-containing protein [Sphingosinicella flava]QPQ55008.1 DUF3035 domain-containing protein [Sphingosinicella flava]
MRIVKFALALTAATLIAGCGTTNGLSNRNAPDEFAVTRNQPLVIPPDFALTPPRPGEAAAQGVDSRAQAIDVLFGGPAPRSAAEQQVINQANGDASTVGARTTASDPNTPVVDKGAVTQTIIAAPEGPGQEATVSTPQ